MPVETLTQEQLIAAVRVHANAHYTNGWDVIVECWEDREIAAEIAGVKTAAAAIRKMRDFIDPVRERGKGDIVVQYESIDHFKERRRFKTLAGAQRYAQKRVGARPEIATIFDYAVSGDGVGKIVPVEGCTLAELFPTSGQ